MLVDIITAFAVLLRHIIFNESDTDELWLRRLAASGFFQDDIDVIYGVVVGHAWMISHDSLPSVQSKCNFLVQFSSSFYRHTWFSQQSLPNVVHTARGSIAGMPLVDIMYALASSRVLDKFHQALCSEGLSSSIVGNDQTPFQLCEVAYCDDTAILVVSDAPHLVNKVSLVTEVAVMVFMSFGLQVSFDSGKTEAAAFFSGAASKAARRSLAEIGNCSRFGLLGVMYALKFVKSYKHVAMSFGSKLCLKRAILSQVLGLLLQC